MPGEGVDYLLDLLSRINKENGVTTRDNGVSQEVEARQGISLKALVQVKPRISMRPYRTFWRWSSRRASLSRLTTRWVKRKITEYLVARSLIHLQSNMQIQYLWTIPEWSHSKIRLPQPYSANLAVAMQTKSTKFRLEVL